MKIKTTGQIIKGIAGVYTVKTIQGDIIKCFPRGKLRQNGNLFIGDIVDVVVDKEGIIEAVRPRTTQLTRPYVSNIQAMVIILAPLPKPDMLLIDKLIIGAIEQDILPILCVNKADLQGCENVIQQVVKDYEGLAKIIVISTITGQGIDLLMPMIKGKYVCLAGQSAVGKSSLINYIFGYERAKTDGLSAKGERGKNTTRHVEIIELPDGTKIADTCGFNMLEMPLFDPNRLSSYYCDFEPFALGCKYKGCNHDLEETCNVKKAVEQGHLSKERYDRYLQLYRYTKNRWEKRYE